MGTGKKMGLIALVILGCAGLFVLVLYMTIKTRSTSLNNYSPFKEWLGKTVLLRRETFIFKEQTQSMADADHAFMLVDSLHSDSKNAVEQEKTGAINVVKKLPAGTKITLQKAIQYTNGVSGFSTPMIFGTVTVGGKTYAIAYQWGELDMEKSFDKTDKCWKFEQAPWQQNRDTAFYALTTAKF